MTRTVLVIEDNPITRKLVRLTLVGEGYEVVEAETGAMALAAMRRKPPDLVLQDLALSDVNGFELIHQLRSIAANDVPILAFTGLADQERILAAGFDELLLKPVEPSRLVATLRTHFDGRARDGVARSEPAANSSSTDDGASQPVAAMLARLTDLSGDEHPSVAETVANVLASFLDASGFSVGAAYVDALDGRTTLCAQIGFSPDGAADLARLGEQETALSVSREPAWAMRAAFMCAGCPSILTVPLTLGVKRIGMLVLGSANDSVSAESSRLARVLAGPITQAVVLAGTVARLVASDHKFRGIADSTGDGIVLTDVVGEITYLNAAAAQLLHSTGAAVGDRLGAMIPFLGPGFWQGNLHRDDGSAIPVEVSVTSFDDPPGCTNRVHVLRDMSERVRCGEFAYLANHDPLTRLFNRRRFGEELGVRLAESRRHGTIGALLVVDLDRFKRINDTFGHPAGDAVLVAVADTLRDNTRECDAVARLGGDEFVVLLTHTTAAGALVCATKLLQRIAELTVVFEHTPLGIGASIGLAVFPECSLVADTIFAAADAALYEAKRLGRGRVSISASATIDACAAAAPRVATGSGGSAWKESCDGCA